MIFELEGQGGNPAAILADEIVAVVEVECDVETHNPRHKITRMVIKSGGSFLVHDSYDIIVEKWKEYLRGFKLN